MTDTPFKPVIYLMAGCPFCFKVRLFLLETGQLDHVTLREFVPGTKEQKAIGSLLARTGTQVAYPTAELTPGVLTAESDAIVAHFATRAGVAADTLPTYASYLAGVFKSLQLLYRENMELMRRQPAG
ncbi:glutathione S-transferase N-terminal domain-containing protein [Methylobacterium sp. E-041]|uniref:glutathione S-transferase N-terminal domain-containing protein n=1 Tax=Methylobacterium sp. E-041 TaxID=2836573 RepID=UPI001FB9C14B|nr:glutathione S-transferase N-terminal domain-containing protein [Methylobacterium sp. E-041]MCJ2107737.1 glutathione S-transferase N-terminal domain-containing protein [Methylobacterium sp. E-041]